MTSLQAPISYTTPQFTEDEFQKEQSSLPAAKVRSMDLEKRGLNAILRETPQIVEQGMADLEKSLEVMPDAGKLEYLQAVLRCPELVKTESDPLLFLRAELYNGRAAAIRLTKYWQLRCKVFGDRAFLPLTQTGEDALSTEDVARLRTGALQILPASTDTLGRCVLYVRRSQLNHTLADGPKVVSSCCAMLTFTLARHCSPLDQLRNVFYILSMACEDPIVQRHGLVLLVDTLVSFGSRESVLLSSS